MANSKQTSGKSFLVQGSILAVAGVITKIIGAVYRVPLVNIMGDTGMGYYGVAFQIYAIALTLTSYSLPLAVSKLVSARVAVGQYRNAYKVFRGALAFAITVGGTAALIIFFGAGFIASELMAMSLSAYALRVLAPCILVVALLGVFRGFFQGNGSMIPTAFSQVLEQIVNAVVSVLGAYLLLKAGRAASDGSLGYAFAAAGGTLGTVAGAASALLLLVFIFSVYRRVLKRQMRKDRTRKRESYQRIFKILFITIAPVLLSSTVYNLCGVVDNAMFGSIMSAQGYQEAEYANYVGILSGKYDTVINVPLAKNSILAGFINTEKSTKDASMIDSIRISRINRNTLLLQVEEKQMIGYIEFQGQCVNFDRQGIIQIITDAPLENVPKIEGIDVKEAVQGERLSGISRTKLNTILSVGKMLEKMENKPDRLGFNELNQLVMYYGDIEVRLGDDENMDEKINRLVGILPELEGMSGILHLENTTEDSESVVFDDSTQEEEVRQDQETDGENDQEDASGLEYSDGSDSADTKSRENG